MTFKQGQAIQNIQFFTIFYLAFQNLTGYIQLKKNYKFLYFYVIQVFLINCSKLILKRKQIHSFYFLFLKRKQ